MSARGRVRPDGKLSMPFLNDVEVAGYNAGGAGPGSCRRGSREFIHLPVVTVSLEEAAVGQLLSLLGEGGQDRPIPPSTPNGTSVLAGRWAPGAGPAPHRLLPTRNRIFVNRVGPPAVRIRFHYEALTHIDEKSAQFRLQNGDVIVVE